ncbi:MAG: alpha/beta hydrolase [Alphaproteobacteria bacterium]|jgi:pimeloyl-ACP methyl ester carboxylesterase|nr:alpha/beta hydrolase [Alphaproteobacteria bacterium]MDP6565180.1 alpha/beta hydrolase [Alphaproteobacteria bacterium]MDP6812299.1 alpha/beta hydrolase [Alphaproteobacteria bacterium]
MTKITSGPASHVYFSQRLRLHYVDWGNEGAPPMLLVHGGRDHCRNWDWVAEAFRDDYHIIAPDLRGHGDSEWSVGGSYNIPEYVYDIAQLVHQKQMAPVTIVSHSLGGMISLQYAGLYPENVKHLVAIEGLGASPERLAETAKKTIDERLAGWVDELRQASGRTPRRYASLEDAFRRMQDENPHLSEAQARHLTVHGANQNEDGSYSWKFDNYVRIFRPYGLTTPEIEHLWSRIACPTLLVRGTESWASDPVEDGRMMHFRNARLANIDGAGHWAHHDRLDVFLDLVRELLAE